ncbi:OmpW family protein [Azospirillum sp.]|uniref:OmpW/AlkL family protein n=1 Tax=Azospirillum sp. TaxID=34012 RepID=UPI002D420375|nr:OmpW family protein [Azospirillum sp.]HYD71379.1 OmpW family protein [Azospirillum sp.]
MTFLKRAAAALLATTAVAAFATTATAQDFKGKSAGDILVRARIVGAIPQEKADLTLGGANIGKGHVENGWTPELDFSYFFTDNIAAELIAGTTRHKIKASTILGEVDVGKTWLLPPTLTVQYHFFTKERVSPYVGAGINYSLFYSKSAAGGVAQSLSLKNRFGWALQAGVDVAVGGPWSINLDVKKIFVKTDLDVGTPLGNIHSNVRLDPWVVGVGVGYRF